jgi:HEAT repeat protein
MLRRMDDNSGLPRVLELWKKPGTHRAEAVRVLGRFKVPAAIDPLVEALLDQDQNVRTAGQQGLAMLLPSLYPYRRFDLASAGYQPSGPAAQREEAVRKIRAWCDAHGKR